MPEINVRNKTNPRVTLNEGSLNIFRIKVQPVIAEQGRKGVVKKGLALNNFTFKDQRSEWRTADWNVQNVNAAGDVTIDITRWV